MTTEIGKLILAKQKEYEDFIDKHCTLETATEILKGLFKEAELDVLFFIGYTPGFNDGDPCEHSSYTVTDSEEIYENESMYDITDYDYEDHKYKAEIQSESFIINKTYNSKSYEERAVHREELDLVNFIFDKLYHTNYQVEVYINKDDEIVVDQSEYYCGY